jgi:general L-amino acid transport system permease protein
MTAFVRLRDSTRLSELWSQRRTRRLLLQAVFLALVALVVAYLVVQALDLKLNFGFLSGPAGFSLSHQWPSGLYEPSDTRLAAYGTGIVNTVRLAFLGILLATLIGVAAGVARLSSNWLVARIASTYVEIIRNTPVLIQIVFWYTAVMLTALPEIGESWNLLDGLYISNRSVALPFMQADGAFGLWALVLLIGVIAAYWTQGRIRRREEATGRILHASTLSFVLFAAIGGVAFAATGFPLVSDIPDFSTTAIGISNVEGGLQITPEFTAILLGLVFYTGAFIAEIVRGSIQALPKGQSEAAAAIGLSGYQRMTLVILPQALRTMIPPLTNQYLNLTKNSSLAIAIAYPELVFVGRTIINGVGHAVPVFLLIFATYLTLSLIISVAMNVLNRRVQLVGQ